MLSKIWQRFVVATNLLILFFLFEQGSCKIQTFQKFNADARAFVKANGITVFGVFDSDEHYNFIKVFKQVSNVWKNSDVKFALADDKYRSFRRKYNDDRIPAIYAAVPFDDNGNKKQGKKRKVSLLLHDSPITKKTEEEATIQKILNFFYSKLLPAVNVYPQKGESVQMALSSNLPKLIVPFQEKTDLVLLEIAKLFEGQMHVIAVDMKEKNAALHLLESIGIAQENAQHMSLHFYDPYATQQLQTFSVEDESLSSDEAYIIKWLKSIMASYKVEGLKHDTSDADSQLETARETFEKHKKIYKKAEQLEKKKKKAYEKAKEEYQNSEARVTQIQSFMKFLVDKEQKEEL